MTELDFSKLSDVPDSLRIRVLFQDDEIIVIQKPPNLRSVPGTAAAAAGGSKQKRDDNDIPIMKPQEAWMQAVRSFSADKEEVSKDPSDVDTYLSRLSSSTKPGASVPRKYATFLRYLHRNHRRIFPDKDGTKPVVEEALAKDMYCRIEERQRPLLPTATRHEESALGQLQLLLGLGDDCSSSLSSSTLLFTVHRLDCATSGVMVFARTKEAASFLAQAWREKETVTKTYLAKVRDWPPWQKDKPESSSGVIELPLAPSDEPLKWRVSNDDAGDDKAGKPSKTLWKVISSEKSSNKPDDGSEFILLELQPVTGRTHQLRIHCAAIGNSGIVGDTLYGAEASKNSFGDGSRLCLHAQRLSFPHPRTKALVEYSAEPDW